VRAAAAISAKRARPGDQQLKGPSLNTALSYASAPDGASIAFNVLSARRPGAPRLVVVADLVLGAYQLQTESPAAHGFLEALQQHFEVLVSDPRGTGFSAGEQATMPLSEAPDDIATLTKYLGWDSYAVLGVMTDGPRAIAHAARHPDRVTGLVLWCAPASMMRMLGTSRGQALSELAARDPELFVDTLAHSLLGWDTPEESRRLAQLVRTGTPSLEDMVRRVHAADAQFALADLAMPTLVMYRRQLDVLTFDMARELVERIEGAQLALIPGSSLAPYAEPSAPVLHGIFDFLGVSDVAVAASAHPVRMLDQLEQEASELTGRQTEVLRLLAGGLTNREIATSLDISVHTVDRHISQIYRRIGARGRAEATGYAIRHALVE
jgi:pimeloyl-ACP methyl ester carboxylesterase/DNA-binding CsgD family transcriptional regulator